MGRVILEINALKKKSIFTLIIYFGAFQCSWEGVSVTKQSVGAITLTTSQSVEVTEKLENIKVWTSLIVTVNYVELWTIVEIWTVLMEGSSGGSRIQAPRSRSDVKLTGFDFFFDFDWLVRVLLFRRRGEGVIVYGEEYSVDGNVTCWVK